MRILMLLICAVALAEPSGVQAKAIMDPAEVKLPAMDGKLTTGKAGYDKFCVSCHGANLVGTDKGPTFLHRVYHPGHHGDRAFLLAPMQGARQHHWKFGDMKPVPGIKQQHLETIIHYIRAIQKANGLF